MRKVDEFLVWVNNVYVKDLFSKVILFGYRIIIGVFWFLGKLFSFNLYWVRWEILLIFGGCFDLLILILIVYWWSLFEKLILW